MSVIHFSDEELAGLWHALGGEPELQYPLQALAIANRAAYMLTYAPRHDDACTIEVPRFEEPAADARDDWSATDRVNLLLYNCISNGGTDFAPEQHRLTLENARFARMRSARRRHDRPRFPAHRRLPRRAGALLERLPDAR